MKVTLEHPLLLNESRGRRKGIPIYISFHSQSVEIAFILHDKQPFITHSKCKLLCTSPTCSSSDVFPQQGSNRGIQCERPVSFRLTLFTHRNANCCFCRRRWKFFICFINFFSWSKTNLPSIYHICIYSSGIKRTTLNSIILLCYNNKNYNFTSETNRSESRRESPFEVEWRRSINKITGKGTCYNTRFRFTATIRRHNSNGWPKAVNQHHERTAWNRVTNDAPEWRR